MFSERGIRRFEKANTETIMSKEFLTVMDASNKLGLPSATQGFTAIVDLKSDGNIYHNSSYSDNSAGIVYNTNGSITNMRNMQVILGGWSFSNPAMIVNEFKIETFDK